MKTSHWLVGIAATGVATALVAGAAMAAQPAAAGHPQTHASARKDTGTMAPTSVQLQGTLQRAPHGPGLVLATTGASYRLHGAPPWYLDQLLSTKIGLSTTVVGRQSGHQIQAQTIAGVTVRSGPGRPPWAGAHHG